MQNIQTTQWIGVKRDGGGVKDKKTNKNMNVTKITPGNSGERVTNETNNRKSGKTGSVEERRAQSGNRGRR